MQNEPSIPSVGAHAPRGLRTAGLAAALIAAGVVVAGVLGRTHATVEAQRSSDAASIPVVHLVPVTRAATSDPLSLPGTLAAWNAARLYARVAAMSGRGTRTSAPRSPRGRRWRGSTRPSSISRSAKRART